MTEELAGYGDELPRYPNILITGGSGYFARQYVARVGHSPWIDRIALYSRNEYMQHAARKWLEPRVDPNTFAKLRWLIGDVRDEPRLTRAMDGVDCVIHAAALKRIEVAEYNVLESVATNVIGTSNVVNAAINAGVRRVVFLSSDKACNPTTTYGLTKALGEAIVLLSHHMAEGPSLRRVGATQRTTFAAVRYGNVAGSTGSVIPIWHGLKQSGHKTVPVSSPLCTRFWTSPEEAVGMVTAAMAAQITPQRPLFLHPRDSKAFSLRTLLDAMELEPEILGLAEREKIHEEMVEGQFSKDAPMLTVSELRERLAELAEFNGGL